MVLQFGQNGVKDHGHSETNYGEKYTFGTKACASIGPCQILSSYIAVPQYMWLFSNIPLITVIQSLLRVNVFLLSCFLELSLLQLLLNDYYSCLAVTDSDTSGSVSECDRLSLHSWVLSAL